VKPTKQANGGIPRTIIPLSARKAERLDLNTVERRGRPFSAAEPAPRIHINGIPEAPTFRPTEEQWKNPFAYLKSIEMEGKKYGVIKIIPPDSWNPDFVIDTEVRKTWSRSANKLLTYLQAISFQDTQAGTQLSRRGYAWPQFYPEMTNIDHFQELVQISTISISYKNFTNSVERHLTAFLVSISGPWICMN